MNEDKARTFVEAGKRPRPGVVGEFILFLKQNKKLWLIPPLAVLLFLSLLVLLGGTAAAPFIYSLF